MRVHFIVPTLLGLLLLGMGLNACSSGSADVSAVPPVRDSTHELLADLESLRQNIDGTLEQRRASDYLSHLRYQESIQSCMGQLGLDYSQPPYLDIYGGFSAEPGYLGAWLSPVSEQSVVGRRLGIEAGALSLASAAAGGLESANPGYENLDDAGRARYLESLDSCEPEQDLYVDLEPPEAAPLRADLEELVSSVLLSPSVVDAIDGYPDCMAREGFPDIGAPWELQEQLQQEFPLSAAPINGAPASADWEEAANRELEAAIADQTCRSAVIDAAADSLANGLQEYQQQNELELAALQSSWEEFRRSTNPVPTG